MYYWYSCQMPKEYLIHSHILICDNWTNISQGSLELMRLLNPVVMAISIERICRQKDLCAVFCFQSHLVSTPKQFSTNEIQFKVHFIVAITNCFLLPSSLAIMGKLNVIYWLFLLQIYFSVTVAPGQTDRQEKMIAAKAPHMIFGETSALLLDKIQLD